MVDIECVIECVMRTSPARLLTGHARGGKDTTLDLVQLGRLNSDDCLTGVVEVLGNDELRLIFGKDCFARR